MVVAVDHVESAVESVGAGDADGRRRGGHGARRAHGHRGEGDGAEDDDGEKAHQDEQLVKLQPRRRRRGDERRRRLGRAAAADGRLHGRRRLI
jgi:hypothetical protein